MPSPAPSRQAEIDQSNILPAGSKRTQHPLKGLFCSLLMAASNTPIVELAKKCIGSPAAQAAMAGFDAISQTFDFVDYHSCKAMTTLVTKKKKGEDPDYPTLRQALMSPDVFEWKASMDKEIETLIKMKTWDVVLRSEAEAKGKKVIKVT